MRFVYSVRENPIGWSVHRDAGAVRVGLSLADAIKYARQLGRAHHERTGYAVTVELVTPEAALLLAQYAGRTIEAPAAA
jgi:hypothetical protein